MVQWWNFSKGKWDSGPILPKMSSRARREALRSIDTGGLGADAILSGPWELPASVGAASTIVLEAVEKIVAPVPVPEFMSAVTIVPPPVLMPSAVFIGDELDGGYGVPWTVGPTSLLSVAPIIGTLVIEVGRRVIYSMALAGAGTLFEYVKKRAHQAGVSARFHTGNAGRPRSARAPTEGEFDDRVGGDEARSRAYAEYMRERAAQGGGIDWSRPDQPFDNWFENFAQNWLDQFRR